MSAKLMTRANKNGITKRAVPRADGPAGGKGVKRSTAVGAKVKKPKAAKTKGDAKPKRVSALDAAAQVLRAAGKPMRVQELIAAMAEKGLWKSPAGKTPHSTVYAAMLREVRGKGKASRFAKVDRGHFAYKGK